MWTRVNEFEEQGMTILFSDKEDAKESGCGEVQYLLGYEIEDAGEINEQECQDEVLPNFSGQPVLAGMTEDELEEEDDYEHPNVSFVLQISSALLIFSLF